MQTQIEDVYEHEAVTTVHEHEANGYNWDANYLKHDTVTIHKKNAKSKFNEVNVEQFLQVKSNEDENATRGSD